MRNRIMILCTFCAIAIFSSAQEKFSIQGIANEELNNQLLYLCLMGDREKAKEVVRREGLAVYMITKEGDSFKTWMSPQFKSFLISEKN